MHGTEATNVSFGKIQHIITQSLKSVQNVLINDKHCVELYGYDVMIDQVGLLPHPFSNPVQRESLRLACSCVRVHRVGLMRTAAGGGGCTGQDLKPWLIEVNASPALSSDNERDYELKFNLIEDFYTCLVRLSCGRCVCRASCSFALR